MRISYNWLREYVDVDLSPGELADRLTLAGLEVEELEDRYQYLRAVVTARIGEVTDHPRSETLKVCRVETADRSYQVVCGAPNTTRGLISALALPGTELPSGQIVAASEIRGIRSEGMLCSEAELVTGPDPSTILSLPENTPLGRNIKEILKLDDWILEIGLTPNRPDCLSIIGVAREVAGGGGGGGGPAGAETQNAGVSPGGIRGTDRGPVLRNRGRFRALPAIRGQDHIRPQGRAVPLLDGGAAILGRSAAH